jgi:acetylornithine deacetylase/succinyl-diaminopimelate desuccinylase-like protein
VALAERGGAWVTATTYGAAAHGSQPHRGVNAITAMARFLLRLDEVVPDTVHPLCGRATVNAALISGGSAPNMVPDRCVVDIDRRTIPGETDPEKVLAPFLALADEIRADDPSFDLRTEIREWILAAESPADTPIAEAIRAAAAAETGAVPPDVGFTGITDARFYLNDAAIPTVIFGPGDLSVAHTADEWIGVDDLVAGARTYARIFASFLGA